MSKSKCHPHPVIPPVNYPDSDILPKNLPNQKYKLGDLVYWHQVKNPDFGRVSGVIYTTQSNCKVEGLHYLISLDIDSPSRSIVHYDFAFEEDLAPLDELCS
ncbi:hypothetical protein [Lyngbya sp. PCC 8106]|uniref:hypothetical protein n=1 Tax=Lyngbya sp. (strain PCC 8106) TaxID=313612 RepID=UPI0000EAB605|nr:hypothetical protein [Lyngbya sp. PCC 8106]EAW35968.1 hypothetical protein L8106_22271 [Lyngbya sp. PCC 8106]